ncbi:hypothetical protein LCGC14_2261750, partial [marine sediment metagenome]
MATATEAKTSNKETTKSFPSRLQQAIKSWEKMTEPMRDHREKMLKYYASGYFDGKEAQKQHPINLIDRGVGIITPFLVSNNPAVLVHSKSPKLKPWANTTELALKHLFDEIKIAQKTLRPAVVNSLFGIGITKTGIMKAEQVEFMGYL